MNWNLITMPASEEMACGYTPSIDLPTEAGALRRFLVSVFAIFGLLAGLQTLIVDHEQPGQRRIAETQISERKIECRDCPAIVQRKDQ